MDRECTVVIDLEVPVPPRWCPADNPPTLAVAEDHADLVGLAELRVGMAAQVVATSIGQLRDAAGRLGVVSIALDRICHDLAQRTGAAPERARAAVGV
jgi:hypothetical protein